MITDADINNWFTYHAPQGNDLDRYQALRNEGKNLAELIIAFTPPGVDQSAAIRKLRECIMTANAAIACNPQKEIVQNVSSL